MSGPSRADVYWIQTNKQTDRETSKIYIEIQKNIVFNLILNCSFQKKIKE